MRLILGILTLILCSSLTHGLDIESGSSVLLLEKNQYGFTNYSLYSASENLNLSTIHFHENISGIGKGSLYTVDFSQSRFSLGAAILDIAETPQKPLIPPTLVPVVWAGVGMPLGDAILSCHSAFAYNSLWIKPAQSITPFLDMDIHTLNSIILSLEHPNLTLSAGKITANADITLFRTYNKGSAGANAHFIIIRNEKGGIFLFDGQTTAHFYLSLGWGFISKYKYISDGSYQGAAAWYQYTIKKKPWEAGFIVAGGIINAKNFHSSLDAYEFGESPKKHITRIAENPAWAIILRPSIKWHASQNIYLSVSRFLPLTKPWEIETITNNTVEDDHNTTVKNTPNQPDIHTLLFAGMEIGMTVYY